MNNVKTVTSNRLKNEYKVLKHKSGLTVYMFKMPKHSSAYAVVSTNYGSVNVSFNETISPYGVAHFLEHKLFQNQDGTDAFELFAKTGANANAFTSFEKTSYLFSCTEDFEKNLEILLDFVFNPYFTEESVEKEKGIIAQEIKMYNDEAGWQVFVNLMKLLYHNHPIREDIAGSVDSISEITPQTLYDCYKAFYHPSNMTLAVTGNFDENVVETLCDKIVKKTVPFETKLCKNNEPDQIKGSFYETQMDISIPYFQIGFKGENKGLLQNEINSIYGEILTDILVGDTSPLYEKLYNKGLINDTFGGEVMSGSDFYVTVFSGESKNPKLVYKKLKEKIEYYKKNGISNEDFEIAKRSLYGRYVRIFSRKSSVASLLTSCHFSSLEMYDIIEKIAAAKKEDVERILKETLICEKSALSVIKPKSKREG